MEYPSRASGPAPLNFDSLSGSFEPLLLMALGTALCSSRLALAGLLYNARLSQPRDADTSGAERPRSLKDERTKSLESVKMSAT